MIMYRTWLLVDQPPRNDEERQNDPLLLRLDEFGLQKFIAGIARPRVGLRIEGELALLGETDKDLRTFFDLVREKGQVLAIALHPAALLRQLHGTVFRWSGNAVQLLGAEDLLGMRDPCFRRIIRFKYISAVELDPLSSDLPAFRESIDARERLLVGPKSLKLTQGTG